MNRKGEWGKKLAPKFMIEGQEFKQPGSKRKNNPQGKKYAQNGQNGQNQVLEQGNQDKDDQSSKNPPKEGSISQSQMSNMREGRKLGLDP